jgi:hypothetical protein
MYQFQGRTSPQCSKTLGRPLLLQKQIFCIKLGLLYKNLVNFPVTLRERSKITNRHIYKYYPLQPKISKQQMIYIQSKTKLPTLVYYIHGQAAKQKYFYLHPAGQFLIQANSRSACKEVSVLNGGRMFINVFTRAYH